MNPAHPPEAGRVLGGRYRLESPIARGGMAEVWEAVDEVLGRHVAVKLLHPHLADDDALRARFHNEAVAAARLVHPSIVAIYDTCTDDGTEAIVMELVRGRTLRDFLDERHCLEPVEVVHIGAEVASALTCAHRAGIVHRDMKPANILLSDDGRVLVTDFGIAKVLDAPDVTRTTSLLGTVKYLAPEQVESGPVDARTDVYALGAVLYESLCGIPPFSGDTPAAVAVARLHRDPVRPSTLVDDVPPNLERTILRALSRRPADRFTTADDLRAALLATRLDQPGGADTLAVSLTEPWAPGAWGSGAGTPPQGTAAATPPRSKRPTTGVVAALLVLVALIVIALLVARTDLGRDLFADKPATTSSSTAPLTARPVTVASVHSFDPEGSGTPGENEASVGNVIDGDPATTWRTEGYASRNFGGLKRGVGFVLALDRPTSLGRIRVDSPVQGWGVEVYVADQAYPTLEGWGSPVAHAGDVQGAADLGLSGAKGSQVLVWITDLGQGDNRMVVSDVTLAG